VGQHDDPYADAVIYDLEYEGMVEDLQFYGDKAKRAAGTVLELGCGTGRLTRHLARQGTVVHGVDRAPDMLRRHRELLALEPPEVAARVTLEEADYRSWTGPGPFGAVLWPFNALHHCSGQDEVRGVLQAARAWIRPDGFMVLDCYLPDRRLYDRDPRGQYEYRDFVDPRTGETLTSWEQGWWDEATRTHHVVYTYRRPTGAEFKSHLQLRMFEHAELMEVIAATGWRLVRETSDFHGRPMDRAALKWVAVLATEEPR
jgi:SAM-dependent methyltransferase